MDKTSRKSCKRCRFDKCVSAGMKMAGFPPKKSNTVRPEQHPYSAYPWQRDWSAATAQGPRSSLLQDILLRSRSASESYPLSFGTTSRDTGQERTTSRDTSQERTTSRDTGHERTVALPEEESRPSETAGGGSMHDMNANADDVSPAAPQPDQPRQFPEHQDYDRTWAEVHGR